MSDEVPRQVAEIAQRLSDARPMRRGSVTERHMKCGQAGCRCRVEEQARHGPYFSVTRAVAGKTSSRYVTKEQAEMAQRQVSAAQEFRKDIEAYWQACEAWADAELDGTQATSEEAAKKGGSKKRSRRSLRRSSTSS